MFDKARLRRRYIKARNRFDRIRDEYDCGLELARTISPRLVEAELELEAVERDIRAAMAKEGWRPRESEAGDERVNS